MVSRSRCAVRPCVGHAVFRSRAAPITVKRPSRPLVEFRVPPEYRPAIPSRSAAAVRRLSWAFVPFSTCKERRSTHRGLCLPATFRLQGLVALLTVYALRARAGFVSHRRRSWDFALQSTLLARSLTRFRVGRTHLPFRFTIYQPLRAESRLVQPRFLGFVPCESSTRAPSV